MVHKLKTIQELIQKKGLDALLIENPVDLFYLTGLSLSKGLLILEPKQAKLFVDGRYIEEAKQQKQVPVDLYNKDKWAVGLRGRVGFDGAFTTYDQYQSLSSLSPEIHWESWASPLKEMRAIKTPEEIGALKRAAQLTLLGINHMKSLLEEGISAEQLAFAFETFCRKRGASHMSFDPIIAFGENSALPHHRAGKTALKKGDVVLMDVGASVDHYRGDITRMEFFGAVDPKLTHLFSLVKKAHAKALHAACPGVSVGKLDSLVREEFRKDGVEELFTHSLGHAVGLETHEYPLLREGGKDSDVPLKAGMVVTIEPGLYIPRLGGARYEDMILITENGHINLSEEI